MRVKGKNNNNLIENKIIKATSTEILRIPQQILIDNFENGEGEIDRFMNIDIDESKVYYCTLNNKQGLVYLRKGYLGDGISFDTTIGIFVDDGWDTDYCESNTKSYLSINIEDEVILTDFVIYEYNIENNIKYDNLDVYNNINVGLNNSYGNTSVNIGKGNFIQQDSKNNLIVGEENSFKGQNSLIVGAYNIIPNRGTAILVAGSGNKANGDLTIGSHNKTTSGSLCCIGSQNELLDQFSVGIGSGVKVSGHSGIAIGNYLEVATQNQIVLGKHNVKDEENKYLYILGNGKRNNKSNANTIDFEGNAWYKGKLSQEGTPTENKDLTTKKYVDDKFSTMFSFNEAGELVVTINGVSKTFVPKV